MLKVRAAELKGVDCAVCEVSWKRLRYISMLQLAMKWMCFTSSGCSVWIWKVVTQLVLLQTRDVSRRNTCKHQYNVYGDEALRNWLCTTN